MVETAEQTIVICSSSWDVIPPDDPNKPPGVREHSSGDWDDVWDDD